jgi:hypothetical protein
VDFREGKPSLALPEEQVSREMLSLALPEEQVSREMLSLALPESGFQGGQALARPP